MSDCIALLLHSQTHTHKRLNRRIHLLIYIITFITSKGGDLLLNQLTAHILLCKQQTVVY